MASSASVNQIRRYHVNKGFALGALDRSEDAIAVYDDLLARFATATEPALREAVARANTLNSFAPCVNGGGKPGHMAAE